MPLPRVLARVASDPAFWRDYLWERRQLPRFAGCTVDLPVADGHALVVDIARDLDVVFLHARAGDAQVELAHDSPAQGCPCVLRWPELELLCRAIAVRDPALPHPGLPLALLHRFAPICVGDDLDAIARQLVTAWRAAGADERTVRDRLERADGRAEGFTWTCTDGRWSLDQQLPPGRQFMARPYGPRFSEHPEFPHQALEALLGAARTTVGDLPAPVLPVAPVPALRPLAWLSLEVPGELPIRPLVDRLDRALREADVGTADAGSGHYSAQTRTFTSLSVSMFVRGPLHDAIALVQRTVGTPPAGAVLRVVAPEAREVPWSQ
jgi:hypothetical protein